MKITHKPPQLPQMVRYGDLEPGAVYQHQDGSGVYRKSALSWVDAHLDSEGAFGTRPNPDTLVIPLDAELVIHGYAGQVSEPGTFSTERLREAEGGGA